MTRNYASLIIGALLLLMAPANAKAVLPGDTDGSGTVSISEVQAVINAFLKDSTIPTAFSKEWLSGKTFYQVWFGLGNDASGNEINDVPVVYKIVFGVDGTIQAFPLLNANNGTAPYNVTDAGLLYFGTDPNEGNIIVSGSTETYIKTWYTIGGIFDNVDLFFFDQDTAMAFASTLTASIPK